MRPSPAQLDSFTNHWNIRKWMFLAIWFLKGMKVMLQCSHKTCRWNCSLFLEKGKKVGVWFEKNLMENGTSTNYSYIITWMNFGISLKLFCGFFLEATNPFVLYIGESKLIWSLQNIAESGKNFGFGLGHLANLGCIKIIKPRYASTRSSWSSHQPSTKSDQIYPPWN